MIGDGAIFRRLIRQHRVGERLHADIISDIFKRVAAYIQNERRKNREGTYSAEYK